MFDFLKKFFGKKEDDMATKDEEQIEEARENIAEKGSDSQTEQDRIDESVGEQEHLDGNEDSQSAKDRVDESEGAKSADEEREEAKEDVPGWAKQLLDAVTELTAAVKAQSSSGANKDAEARMDAAFGIGEGVFQGDREEHAAKRMSKEEIADVMKKLM